MTSFRLFPQNKVNCSWSVKVIITLFSLYILSDIPVPIPLQLRHDNIQTYQNMKGDHQRQHEYLH